MQRTRLLNRGGFRFGIAALALVILAPAYLLHAQAVQTSAETLARVRQAGILRLGYYPNAQPFSYQDGTGRPAGYGVALCQEIAKDLKSDLGLPSLDVQFVSVNITDRYDVLQQGKVDLMCGPSVETLARRKEVAFSIPIFPAGIGALMRSDAPAQLRDVLAGGEAPYRPQWRGSLAQALQQRSFSAVPGTTVMTWLNSKQAELKINSKIVPVENHDIGVQRVLDRSSDVLFGERSILLDAAKRSPYAGNLIVLDRLFTYEPLALALGRGDEEFRLLVDRALSRLYRTGAILDIYKGFFGIPGENTLTFFRLSAIPE